jgi:ribosomal protein S4
MGRAPSNKTYEQVLEEARERSREYYEQNKDAIKKKRMERYNQLKEGRELLTEGGDSNKKVL